MTLSAPAQVSTRVEDPRSVDAAIESRFSARAFLPRPVPREAIEDILRVASRAPSGTNTQPWKVYVLQGTSRDTLVDRVCAAHDALRADPSLAAQYQEEYDYYPEQWVSPYIDRRRENGWGLYGLLGIGKGDKDKMHAQHQRNYRFFDAPVALVVTMQDGFGSGGYMDLGMALYGLMLAAQSKGLATCAIGALASYPNLIRQHLGLDATSHIVCGMALGYADPKAPVNQTQTTRCELDDYFQQLG